MPTEENSPKRASPTGRERPGRETLPGKTPEREQPKPVKATKRSPKSPRRLPDSREIPQKRREENLFRRYWLSLKRRNARSELIWIGNKQMICRQPDLGDYGLASYAPAQPDDAPWDATLLESRWAELRNCRLAWEPGRFCRSPGQGRGTGDRQHRMGSLWLGAPPYSTLCDFYLGFIQQESLPFFLPRAGWRQGWPRPSGYGHFRATAPPGRTAANTAHAMGSISRPVLTSISRNPAMQPTELPPALSYCLYP